MTKKYNGHNRA